MDKRKRYTAEEKINILREVVEDGKAVSAVADAYKVPPNNIFNWRKQLFEGAGLFEQKRPDVSRKAQERRAARI